MSDNARERNIAGANEVKIGNYATAIAIFTEVIKNNPEDYHAYCNRGIVRGILQKTADEGFVKSNRLQGHEDAIEDFDMAVKLNPKNAWVYYHRGIFNHNFHRYKEAIEDYTQAIRFKDDYAVAYINRGAAYADIGKLKIAFKDISKGQTIQNFQKFEEAFKKFEEALSDYSKAISLNRKYAETYINRGRPTVVFEWEENKK